MATCRCREFAANLGNTGRYERTSDGRRTPREQGERHVTTAADTLGKRLLIRRFWVRIPGGAPQTTRSEAPPPAVSGGSRAAIQCRAQCEHDIAGVCRGSRSSAEPPSHATAPQIGHVRSRSRTHSRVVVPRIPPEQHNVTGPDGRYRRLLRSNHGRTTRAPVNSPTYGERRGGDPPELIPSRSRLGLHCGPMRGADAGAVTRPATWCSPSIWPGPWPHSARAGPRRTQPTSGLRVQSPSAGLRTRSYGSPRLSRWRPSPAASVTASSSSTSGRHRQP